MDKLLAGAIVACVFRSVVVDGAIKLTDDAKRLCGWMKSKANSMADDFENKYAKGDTDGKSKAS